MEDLQKEEGFATDKLSNSKLWCGVNLDQLKVNGNKQVWKK